MRPKSRRILAVLSLAFVPLACDDDPADPGSDGPFDLTFAGDATFQGPHGGQDIAVALVSSAGAVLETMTGVVSAAESPAFTFTFANALDDGESYEVHYWIDANFGGGTAGVCDTPPTDHMWNVAINSVSGDVSRTEGHDAGAIEDVCSSF
jgi:hypothetical protein